MAVMNQKSRLRSEFRARRRDMGAERRRSESADLSAAIRSHLTGARIIAGYQAAGTEPDPAAALKSAHDAGAQVLLPVCRPAFQLGWVTWHPGIEMRPSDFAPVHEPVGRVGDAAAAARADVVLLPATAVDASGTRLGQGGGYYDRFLAELRRLGSEAKSVAAVYEHEFLPAGALPREATDQPVDGAITAAGLTWF